MPKFSKVDFIEAHRVTPIGRVQDEDVWKHLVTPFVRRLLGNVTHVGAPQYMETQQGAFPGDEASNLNGHIINGGKPQMVRFPYLNSVHRTVDGVLVVKRDKVKTKVIAWFGDPFKGKGEVVFKVALRDRRFDGTPFANDTALLEYPMDDPEGNKPLPYGLGLENTVYGFLPGTRISELQGEEEFERFIAGPFAFMDRPELFLKLFWRAWNSGRSPGQIGKAIPDVARHILPGFDAVAAKYGYDFVEGAVSHYHVVRWELNYGYRCTYQKDVDTLAAFAEGIKRLKESGVQLTRPQESWLCVLQNLRPIEAIPAHLYLNGPVWPQTNLDQKNLWINHPVNEAARKALPGSIA